MSVQQAVSAIIRWTFFPQTWKKSFFLIPVLSNRKTKLINIFAFRPFVSTTQTLELMYASAFEDTGEMEKTACQGLVGLFRSYLSSSLRFFYNDVNLSHVCFLLHILVYLIQS